MGASLEIVTPGRRSLLHALKKLAEPGTCTYIRTQVTCKHGARPVDSLLSTSLCQRIHALLWREVSNSYLLCFGLISLGSKWQEPQQEDVAKPVNLHRRNSYAQYKGKSMKRRARRQHPIHGYLVRKDKDGLSQLLRLSALRASHPCTTP